eukprot:1330982-Amorphochlora_amoeboformis.AAC.1
MSQKAIREHTGKRLLTEWFSKKYEGILEFQGLSNIQPKKNVLVHCRCGAQESMNSGIWRLFHRLQISRAFPTVMASSRLRSWWPSPTRGKLGLVKLKATWEDAKKWIEERRGKELKVGSVKDTLDFFLVETFVPHKQEEEYYVCIQSVRCVPCISSVYLSFPVNLTHSLSLLILSHKFSPLISMRSGKREREQRGLGGLYMV